MSSSDFSSKVETITPEIAAKMRALGGLNRPIGSRVVARYAADMAAGGWKFNGEAIVISVSNRLLDGQHRLEACIQSGVPFKTVVVRGVPDDAFDTLDSGRGRSIKDVLAMFNVPNPNNVAAALTIVALWERGWSDYQPPKKGEPRGTRTRAALTVREYQALLERNLGVVDAVKMMERAPFSEAISFISLSQLAAFFYIFSREGGDDRAEEFFRLLATGAGMDFGHPVLMLRNVLINARLRRVGLVTRGSGSGRSKNTVGVFIKAWNAWVEGRTVGMIRFRPSFETFPEISKPQAA